MAWDWLLLGGFHNDSEDDEEVEFEEEEEESAVHVDTTTSSSSSSKAVDLEAGGTCSTRQPLLTPLSSSLNTSPSSSLSPDDDPCCHDEEEEEAYHDPLNDDDGEEDDMVSFRELRSSDRRRIQQLHEEWFPVVYSDEFYDQLCTNHRLSTSGDVLFTCVATLPKVQQQQQQQENVVYCQPTTTEGGKSVPLTEQRPYHYHPSSSTQQQQCPPEEPDEIIGCCVGSFVHHSRLNPETTQLLLPNVEEHKRLFYIMTLGTVSEFRNLGVASSLMDQCSALVESDPHCGALYLHVIPFNTKAIRFYEKLGFWRVTTIPNYYNIEGQQYDCYLYAKYFHGNRGHLTLYKIVAGAISSLWGHLKAPFSSSSSSSSTDVQQEEDTVGSTITTMDDVRDAYAS